MTNDRETFEMLVVLGMVEPLAALDDSWLPKEEPPDAQGLPPPINWPKTMQMAREVYPQTY